MSTTKEKQFIPHTELSSAANYLRGRTAGDGTLVPMVGSAMVAVAAYNMRQVEGSVFAAEYLYQLADALATEDLTAASPLHLPAMRSRQAELEPERAGRRLWWSRRRVVQALAMTAQILGCAWLALLFIETIKGAFS